MPRQIHPKTLATKLEAGDPVYLLDVRQPWEHEHCRLPNSTLIPLGELPERLAEVEVPAGAAVVVYCHHGVRSLSGAAILEANGFGEAYSLAGGIEAWSLFIDPTVPRY
ncbi:MAG TPA: rhodanese-like domain-containing protein [Gemmataceae bacterium]|jgi:rhodanese-related sulfurtransferase|nr:rhodanese-like domain-containing protein [Gemmataceae bacterium]